MAFVRVKKKCFQSPLRQKEKRARLRATDPLLASLIRNGTRGLQRETSSCAAFASPVIDFDVAFDGNGLSATDKNMVFTRRLCATARLQAAVGILEGGFVKHRNTEVSIFFYDNRYFMKVFNTIPAFLEFSKKESN